jgi:hypothetical protein
LYLSGKPPCFMISVLSLSMSPGLMPGTLPYICHGYLGRSLDRKDTSACTCSERHVFNRMHVLFSKNRLKEESAAGAVGPAFACPAN